MSVLISRGVSGCMRDPEIDYENGNILKKSFEIVPVQPLPPGTREADC